MRVNVRSLCGKRGDERFVNEVVRTVEGNLSRFGDRIRNVEVLLIDEDEKPDDKRCLIEARLADWAPIAVRAHAGTYQRALTAGAEKIAGTIEELEDRAYDTLPG